MQKIDYSIHPNLINVDKKKYFVSYLKQISFISKSEIKNESQH